MLSYPAKLLTLIPVLLRYSPKAFNMKATSAAFWPVDIKVRVGVPMAAGAAADGECEQPALKQRQHKAASKGSNIRLDDTFALTLAVIENEDSPEFYRQRNSNQVERGI